VSYSFFPPPLRHHCHQEFLALFRVEYNHLKAKHVREDSILPLAQLETVQRKPPKSKQITFIQLNYSPTDILVL
jgi:hypothetical protein